MLQCEWPNPEEPFPFHQSGYKCTSLFSSEQHYHVSLQDTDVVVNNVTPPSQAS